MTGYWHNYLLTSTYFRDKTSCAMKCIESGCSAFYVDPSSKECILGSLQDPCLASQLPNAGITVYRKNNLKKLDCVDCLMEIGFDYSWHDINIGASKQSATGATDGASCWSFCRSNYPNAKYFTFQSGECYCKTSNANRRKNPTSVSGEVICNSK